MREMELLGIVRNVAIATAVLLALASAAGLVPGLWPWRRWSKTGTLIALGAQTGIGALGLARKPRSPVAFFVPLLGTLLLAGWWLDPKAPFLAYGAPLVELAIVLTLAGCALRTYLRGDQAFEVAFQRLLDRWLPGKGAGLSALAALDIGGFRYLAGGWRRPPPSGLSYHRNNATLVIVSLVIVTALPELLIIELFSTGKPFVWHAIDVAIHLYAIFWSVAIFVSFRDRPHCFANGELVVRRGVFETIRVPLEAIEQIEPARPLDKRERRSSPETAYLSLFESPLIKISLSEFCELQRAIGRPHMVKTIYFAVDEPNVAISKIRRRLRPST